LPGGAGAPEGAARPCTALNPPTMARASPCIAAPPGAPPTEDARPPTTTIVAGMAGVSRNTRAAHPARPRPPQRRGDTDRALERRGAGAGAAGWARTRLAPSQSWGAPIGMGCALLLWDCAGDACDCGRMADHGHCGARMSTSERYVAGRHPTAVGVDLPCDRSRRPRPTMSRCTLGILQPRRATNASWPHSAMGAASVMACP